MAESEDESGGGHATGRSTNRGLSLREQDRLLPIANVGRIMKKALPANGKISKEAKETVQECVSEFISFITGEASEKCQREKRKTINGDDLLWAMTTLGFEDYVEPLKIYLQQFREMEGEKFVGARGREGGGEEGSGFAGGTGTGTGTGTGMMMMTMGQHQPEHRQGHLYGSSGAHQTAVSGTGFGGRGPGYSSLVSNTGRPS